MARIRTIKPEFPQSESVGRLSRDARLLFIMLWTIVDDEGRARANSRLLANLLYPYDDDAKRHMDAWLAALAKEKLIALYEVDGTRYLVILKWLEHQKIDKPSKSRLPEAPSREFANIREDSPIDREASATDLVSSTVVPRTKERIDQPPRASRFGEFWSVYPRRVGKAKAQQLFDKITAKDSADLIIAAAGLYATKQAGTEEKYIAHAATWLNGRRWEDEDVGQVIRLTAFNSPEELEGQRLAKERLYGQAGN